MSEETTQTACALAIHPVPLEWTQLAIAGWCVRSTHFPRGSCGRVVGEKE